MTSMPYVDSEYTRDAIQSAATCLLWQASDVSADGGAGFPDRYLKQYAGVVVRHVRYLTEAVTAFLATDGVAGWLEADKISAGQAGHDFILTANRHGAGFWDRGTAHGDQLTEATRGYSFDAEFALGPRGGLAWLCVENIRLR